MKKTIMTIGSTVKRGDIHIEQGQINIAALEKLNLKRDAYDIIYCQVDWNNVEKGTAFRLMRQLKLALNDGGILRIRKEQSQSTFIESCFNEFGFDAIDEAKNDPAYEKAGGHLLLKKKQSKAVTAEPLVSILIPAYRGTFLKEALESAFGQTYKNIEIILCDDDESGGVRNAAEPYLDNPLFHYHKNPTNVGSRRNYALCVEKSSGDYIKFLNDDDILDAECVERMTAVLNAHDNVQLVTSYRKLIDETGNVLPDSFNTPLKNFPAILDGASLTEYIINRGQNVIGEPTTVMFRRKALQRIKPDMFSYAGETALRNGDLHLWLSLLLQGDAAWLPGVLSFFRLHEGQEQKQARFLEQAQMAWEDLKNRTEARGYDASGGTGEIKYVMMVSEDDVFSTSLRGTVSKKPLASIVIPVFNKVEFTRACLKKLYENTDAGLFEIIIVDNASSDGTAAFLEKAQKHFPNLKVISNTENAGFSGANNQGARMAQGKYILMLNNDTEPQPGWLEAMLEIAEHDSRVGAVGSKLLFPDGTIQHAGVAIYDDSAWGGETFVPRHVYYTHAADYPDANKARCYQVLTGAALLIRKKLYDAMNGLDERFWNGYEDVDFCLRLGEKGYLCVYQPKSVIVHHESQSGSERFRKVNHNIRLLAELWDDKIKHDVRITQNNQIEVLPTRRFFDYEGPAGTTLNTDDPRPLVSIIMLTCNALEYTKKCVASLYEHTFYPFELILVDNASSDGTRGYLKKLSRQKENITLVLNKQNKGFAAGNNQGVKKARGRYIMLLNNDVIVSTGWLEEMVSAYERDDQIGMVGPLTNSISGLQMLQNLPYKDIPGFHKFAAEFRAAHRGKVTPRRRIAGFAVLMSRELYRQVKGLDESFGVGNFEDDDLCLKVREKGYAIMVAEGAFIHHFGSQSFKANGVNIIHSLEEKGQVFRKKWPHVDYDELLEIKNPLHEAHPRQIAAAMEQIELGRFDEAEKLFADVLQYNPLSGEALLGLGLVNRSRGDNEPAKTFFQRCLDHYPDNPHVYNQLGMIAFVEKDIPAAENYFITAISKDPAFVDAQRNYGQVLIEKGDYQNGVLAFNRILKNHPNDLPSLVTLAGFCLEAGKAEQALEYIAQAETVDRDDPDVIEMRRMADAQVRSLPDNAAEPEPTNETLDRADELLEKGDVQEAAEIYQTYLKKENNGHSVRAWFGLGLAFQMQQKPSEALNCFEKLLALDGSFGDAYSHAGLAAFATGATEQATDYFRTAAQIKQTAHAKRMLADALIETGVYEEGVALLIQTLQEHPDDADTIDRVAEIYGEAGKAEEAEKLFSRAALLREQFSADTVSMQD